MRCTNSAASQAIFNVDEINSTERNQIDSPLLRLPGELRNRIYEYALDGRIWHIGYRERDGCPRYHVGVIKATEVSDACSLLRVCHQTHAEAHHLPLSLITYNSLYAHYLRAWFADRGSRMASAATIPSLQACYFEGWFNASYSSFGLLWWQDEDLCFTNLPCLRSIELVVDFRSWVNEEISAADSLGYNPTDLEYAELHKSFIAFKTHVEALNPGVTCTVNAADTGWKNFDAFLARTGKKSIV
jgi:hypothetical protein